MKERIRVAFFADILIKDFDGASRTMYQLIERIPQDDFEFIFFTGMPPKEDIGHKVVVMPSIKIPFNSTYKLALPLLKFFTMRRFLDRYRPDVIHISSPSPLGDFAFHYRKKKKIPVLTIYHTHFISYISYYLRLIPFLTTPVKKTVAFGQKLFYKQANLIYVPTENIIEELGDYGFDKTKMKIWQRGIDHHLFHPSKRDINFIKGITQNDKPNILFASRLVWEKNLETLIKVYKLSKEKGDKYNIIIAGDGVASDDLRENMPSAFHLGRIDHQTLAILYASSDIFLFPSISETYGNVVVEAMASGCICVIAKGGGSQSLVLDGVTGYLCSPNEPSDYLQRVDEVLSDEEKRNRIRKAGLDFTTQLNWETLANTYFEDIKALAQGTSPYQ